MFYRRPESGTLKCGFARARVGFGDGGVWVLSGCGRAETVGLRGSAVVVLRRAVDGLVWAMGLRSTYSRMNMIVCLCEQLHGRSKGNAKCSRVLRRAVEVLIEEAHTEKAGSAVILTQHCRMFRMLSSRTSSLGHAA